MWNFHYPFLGILTFAFNPSVRAQITLSEIQVASCASNVIAGTASYSTDMYLPTDEPQRIPAGNFWDQGGAVWEFSTDTPGIKFGFAEIPGTGAANIPQAGISAIVIDGSSTVWTLSVPTPSAGEYDIVFGIATTAVSPSTTSSVASTTTTEPAPTTIGTAAAKRRRDLSFAIPLPLPMKAKRRLLNGAQVRRGPQATSAPPAGQYHLIIKGSYPCKDQPGIGAPSSQTGTSDPSIATACFQNSILPNSAAWAAYGVSPNI